MNRNIAENRLSQLYGVGERFFVSSEPLGSTAQRMVKWMNSTRTMMAEKIAEINPTLDILGSDRKILQVACEDFANYFRFSRKLAEATTAWSVSEMMEKFRKDEPVEFESFLAVWVGLWLNKWKARVKLLFGKQSQNSSGDASKTCVNVESIWGKLECKEEMKDIIVSALIRNAEICGTVILAENLLKKELGKIGDQEFDQKQLVTVLNNTLAKAREMAQRVGPLIYVKVDQAYYSQ